MRTNQKILSKSLYAIFENIRIGQQIVFGAFLLLCMTSYASPGIALLMGLIIANLFGNPFLHLNHKATTILLQFSVVGLGFGMNINNAIVASQEGLLVTIAQ